MKRLSKISTLVLLALLGLGTASTAMAATSPTLTGSLNYSVLAGSTVTCTGASTITGNVGVAAGTSITGFPVPCVVSPGTLEANTASAIAAQADNLTTFGALDQGCDQTFGAVDLTVQFPAGVGPGVYCSTSSFSLSGNLNLTGTGVWIFKTVSTLITSPGSSITGGNACDVWWRIGSSAILDTTTSFLGNILALTDINLNNGASLNGRAMAQTGQVVLDNNNISGPSCTPPPPPPEPSVPEVVVRTSSRAGDSNRPALAATVVAAQATTTTTTTATTTETVAPQVLGAVTAYTPGMPSTGGDSRSFLLSLQIALLLMGIGASLAFYEQRARSRGK